MTHMFFILTVALYSCATAAYLACLLRTSPKLTLWAGRILVAGFTAHLLSTIHLAVNMSYLPLTNMQESLSFFSLAIVGAFIIFERKYKVTTLGSFIIPVALIMLIASSSLHAEVRHLPPILQSNWFWFHALLAFASYACFTIAAGVAVMYLIQRYFLKTKQFGALFQKLPSRYAGQYQLSLFDVWLATFDGCDYFRLNLVREGYGELLGMGPQADLVADHLVYLCGAPAWPAHYRLAGKACRYPLYIRFYRCPADVFCYEAQYQLVACCQ